MLWNFMSRVTILWSTIRAIGVGIRRAPRVTLSLLSRALATFFEVSRASRAAPSNLQSPRFTNSRRFRQKHQDERKCVLKHDTLRKLYLHIAIRSRWTRKAVILVVLFKVGVMGADRARDGILALFRHRYKVIAKQSRDVHGGRHHDKRLWYLGKMVHGLLD